MTAQQMMRLAREYVIDWYDELSGHARKRRRRYIRYAIGAGACIVLLGTLIGLYRWYSVYRERVAEKSLALCMDSFLTANRSMQPRWADVAEQCAHEATTHTHSYLYPYFKALQTEALVKSDDMTHALEVMEVMHASMRSSDPLYNLFALKYALMQLDSADEAVKARGLEALKRLAENSSNLYTDAAQFYLGQYYWSNNQVDEARGVWKQLLSARRMEQGMTSPWAEIAVPKIDA